MPLSINVLMLINLIFGTIIHRPSIKSDLWDTMESRIYGNRGAGAVIKPPFFSKKHLGGGEGI